MEAKNVYKNQYHDTAMRFNGFFKLMCVWKGSVIKLIYHDLAMFLILYGILSVMYRNILIRYEPAGEYFELLIMHLLIKVSLFTEYNRYSLFKNYLSLIVIFLTFPPKNGVATQLCANFVCVAIYLDT